MDKDLSKLEPKELWNNFYQLTQIPRPSKKEEKIIAFIKDFGESLGLETIVDEVGNVVIKKPATAGFENMKTVAFQTHLDMVPQKNSDKVHDFANDPIEAYIDGEWVTANGTTLGADNGIGVAAALTVLESKTLKHGPIEALFTIDEETGMTGAFGLKGGLLDADILLNLDSEDEGELYVGCAGGMNGTFKFAYTEEPVPSNVKAYEIKLRGFKGGHSGIDIPLGKGNANKTMNRFLLQSEANFGLRLASISGGSLRNAIPRESTAVVVIPNENAAEFLASVQPFRDLINYELSGVEPNFSFEASETELPVSLLDPRIQRNVFLAVYACPNGVIRMSDSMPGLVETSTNLASVKSQDGVITVQCLLRSSVDSAKTDLAQMMESVFRLAGANVQFDGNYPGWKPNLKSPVLNVMQHVYQDEYGKVPEIKAIHAGLECGILGGVYPKLDMISFGPTIRHPHSPDEKVNIETVEKFWNYLVKTLETIPNK